MTPKLSYKDQMDILWSLEKNADRLDNYEGDDKETARKSAKRLRKLRERLGGSW